MVTSILATMFLLASLVLFGAMAIAPLLGSHSLTTIVREASAEDRVISIIPAPMPERAALPRVSQPLSSDPAADAPHKDAA